MSKLQGTLTYKDWCILKHSLSNSIDTKEEQLVISHIIGNCELFINKDEIIKKEIKEEKLTLERVTKLTSNFKNYINGYSRHY